MSEVRNLSFLQAIAKFLPSFMQIEKDLLVVPCTKGRRERGFEWEGLFARCFLPRACIHGGRIKLRPRPSPVAVAAAIKMIVNTMTARRILAVVARTPEMQTPTEIEPASAAASADCAMRC